MWGPNFYIVIMIAVCCSTSPAQDEVAVAGENFSLLRKIVKDIREDCEQKHNNPQYKVSSDEEDCIKLVDFFDTFDTEFMDKLNDPKIIGVALIPDDDSSAKPIVLSTKRKIYLPKKDARGYLVRLESGTGNHHFTVTYDQVIFLEIYRQLCSTYEDPSDRRSKFQHELSLYVNSDDSCMHSVAHDPK